EVCAAIALPWSAARPVYHAAWVRALRTSVGTGGVHHQSPLHARADAALETAFGRTPRGIPVGVEGDAAIASPGACQLRDASRGCGAGVPVRAYDTEDEELMTDDLDGFPHAYIPKTVNST